MTGYQAYFERALAKGINGFKPVYGGTGLGKTNGIIACLEETQDQRKFIYTAHRHNLLQEMATKLDEKGIEYVYLKSDADIFKGILHTPEQLEQLKQLFEDPVFKKYKKYLEESYASSSYLKSFRFAKKLDECKSALKALDENDPQVIEDTEAEKTFHTKTKWFTATIKSILFEASKVQRLFIELAEHKEDEKWEEKNPEKIKQAKRYEEAGFFEQDHEDLRSQHPLLYILFPFWEFQKTTSKRILLVTIQKLFDGFFDGSKSRNLYKLKGFVLFLDEFEFLESVLLDKILSQESLDDPFLFVAYFYHNYTIKRSDPRYLGKYPTHKQELETFWEQIETLQAQFSFPDIRFFTIKDTKLKNEFNGAGLYQSNYATVNHPIFLEPDKKHKKYWVSSTSQENSVSTFTLLKAVRRLTTGIIRFFLELRTQDENLAQELLEDVFPKTEYRLFVNRLALSSIIPNLKQGERGAINNFSYLYHRGFGMYSLQNPLGEAEVDELCLSYYLVNTSPEKCILTLTRQNFVFGLSATSHIKRILARFNEEWIQSELNFDSDNKVQWIEPDQEDQAIIQALTSEKNSLRNNSLNVYKVPALDNPRAKHFIECLQHDSSVYDVAASHEFHANRLEFFFETLQWIADNPLDKLNTRDSHLLFFNSIVQVRYILENPNLDLYQVQSVSPFHYRFTYQKNDFWLILLNADAHRYFFEDTDHEDSYYNLFYEGIPVLIVTQYPSASNGVNLHYFYSPEHRERGESQDFQTIHFLEAPHFYFSNTQEADPKTKEHNIKADLWKLAQLFEAGKMSPELFNVATRSIFTKRLKLNDEYKDTNDYVLNQLATIIQALGRIERVWTNVGLQRARVTPLIIEVFRRYLYTPKIKHIIADSRDYYSTLTRLFIADIATQIPRPQEALFPSEFELDHSNQACQVKLGSLRDKIYQIQTNQLTGDTALECITNWRAIREASLRLQFQSKLLIDVFASFYSENIGDNGVLIDRWHRNTAKLDSEFKHYTDYRKWDFNRCYESLSKNKVVRRYFDEKGYQLHFYNNSNQKYFTPYFFQSIFLGALGEEAVKAIFQKNERHPYTIKCPEEIHLSLFEVVDFVVPELHWFVDVKYYSQDSMDGLPNNTSQTNLAKDFLSQAPNKLKVLRHYDSQAKLLLINANDDTEGEPIYYQADAKTLATPEDFPIGSIPSLGKLEEVLGEFE